MQQVNDQDNDRIVNPELFKVPDYLRKQLEKYIQIKKELIQIKQNLNKAQAEKNLMEQTQLQEKYSQLEQEHLKENEIFILWFKKFIEDFIKQLNLEKPKKFILFTSKFLDNQSDIIDEMKNQLKESGLEIELKNNDFIIYSEQMKAESFQFIVRNPNYVRINQRQNITPSQNKENKNLLEETKNYDINIDVNNQSIQSFEPDWVSNINIQVVGQTQIQFSFLAPDDNGAPIDKYQIYIVDTRVEPTKFTAFMQSIPGGNDSYTVDLKFSQINNIDTSNMILPFDQNIQICIRARNQHGWSLKRNLVIFPVHIQYYDKTTLYMKGNLFTIPLDIVFQDEISIKSSQDINEDSILCQTQLVKVLIEEDNIRSVSLNFNGLIVNSNSEIAQWGWTLSFLNDADSGAQITENDFIDSPIYAVPIKVPVKLVSAATNFSFCISVIGQVYGWGANDKGQLGIGSLTSHVTPQLLSYFSDNKILIDDVKCGQQAAIAKSNDGTVYAWGYRQLLMPNTSGLIEIKDQFGSVVNYACSYDGDFVSINPREIKGLQAASITAGYAHFGILSKTGQIFVWGDNTKLALGLNEAYNQSIKNILIPIILDLNLQPGQRVKEISFGSFHSLACIHHQDYDEILSWGSNDYGQCGQNLTNDFCTINKVQGIPSKQRIKSISAGFDHNIFLTNLNELYGFGSNLNYQLTDKPIDVYRKAIKFDGLPNIKKIVAGYKVTGLLVL